MPKNSLFERRRLEVLPALIMAHDITKLIEFINFTEKPSASAFFPQLRGSRILRNICKYFNLTIQGIIP